MTSREEMSENMVRAADELFKALRRVESLIDSDEPPHAISFTLLVHDKTRRPYRVLTRTESRHEIEDRRHPRLRPVPFASNHGDGFDR